MNRSPVGPGRHQQHLGLAARRLRNEMSDLVGRRDVGAKRLGERIDQRVVAQHAVDVVGGNDAHADPRFHVTPPAASMNGGDASSAAGTLRRGCSVSSRPRRSRASASARRARARHLLLPQPGGDAADHDAEATSTKIRHEQRQLQREAPDARYRTDRTRR